MYIRSFEILHTVLQSIHMYWHRSLCSTKYNVLQQKGVRVWQAQVQEEAPCTQRRRLLSGKSACLRVWYLKQKLQLLFVVSHTFDQGLWIYLFSSVQQNYLPQKSEKSLWKKGGSEMRVTNTKSLDIIANNIKNFSYSFLRNGLSGKQEVQDRNKRSRCLCF